MPVASGSVAPDDRLPSWCGPDLLATRSADSEGTSFKLIEPLVGPGTGDSRVTELLLTGHTSYLSASPDGRWLVAMGVHFPEPPSLNELRGKEMSVYRRETLLAGASDEPAARVTAQNGWFGRLMWAPDSSKLAMVDEAESGGEPPGQTRVVVAEAPAFQLREVPLDPGPEWEPIAFSTDGRYLALAGRWMSLDKEDCGAVFDTVTGAVTPTPQELNWSGLTSSGWIGPTLLCGATGGGGLRYLPICYDLATGRVSEFPWATGSQIFGTAELSPDGKYAALQACVTADGPDLGPFGRVPKGWWVFIFPVEAP